MVTFKIRLCSTWILFLTASSKEFDLSTQGLPDGHVVRGHWSGNNKGSKREEDPSTPGDIQEWQSWIGNIYWNLARGTAQTGLHVSGAF